MNVIICDDHYEQVSELKNHLEKNTGISTITVYSDWKKLVANLNKSEAADLIFMDIQLQDQKSGLEVAQTIYQINPKTKIIYITGYVDQYVQNLFFYKANVRGIIAKPIKLPLVDTYIEKVRVELEAETRNVFVLPGRRLEQDCPSEIPYSDILYLESQGHYVCIITPTGQYKIHTRMIDLANSLPTQFIRCHKGFIINLDHLSSFNTSGAIMENEKKIPLGRVYYEEFKEKFWEYVERKM